MCASVRMDTDCTCMLATRLTSHMYTSVHVIRNQFDLRTFLATLHCYCRCQQPSQLAEEAGAEREQMERQRDGKLEVGTKE